MVFYRKYRPQIIADLDLSEVRDKLTALLKSKDLPHAFLFTGSKGLGKTSAARILAKAINCERRLASSWKKEKTNSKTSELTAKRYSLDASIEPCNICSFCISITNGSNIDVIEIDGASNRGVDEIRDLREKIKFTPSTLQKKVYIIDEVHMLTTEAFNALLKTLEEPPAHALFILCTTEFWKLPATIVSRTFVIQFNQPTHKDLSKSVRRISEGEGLKIDDSVVETLFSYCEGSFRDAHKIIEELSFQSVDHTISQELFENVYKVQSVEKYSKDIIKFLAQKNGVEALKIIDEVYKRNIDMRLFIEHICENLRQILLGSLEEKNKTFLSTNDAHQLLNLFSDAYTRTKGAVVSQLPLELAVIEWCFLTGKSQTSHVFTEQVVVETKAEKKEPTPAKIDNSVIEKLTDKNDLFRTKEIKNYTESELLIELIDIVKKENHSIAGILRSSKVAIVDNNTFEVIAPYKFHGERLNDMKVKSMLENYAATLLGKKMNIKVSVRPPEKKKTPSV